VKLRLVPGPRHYPCAVVRADLVFIGLDDHVQRCRIQIAFFHQQALQCPYAHVHLAEVGMVVVVVVLVVRVIVVVLAHGRMIG
jgi:hypothetical protein